MKLFKPQIKYPSRKGWVFYLVEFNDELFDFNLAETPSGGVIDEMANTVAEIATNFRIATLRIIVFLKDDVDRFQDRSRCYGSAVQIEGNGAVFPYDNLFPAIYDGSRSFTGRKTS
ncbi:MAG TPA: hypothetical protein PKD52_09895 [Clostridiales bacterium]|nr:hypothetical protein [Clostridiales bacterium]